ncbi:SCO family protein [Aestuariicella sp. G3-2]|uniref:SCO family protein n=1 Tax=Pseudomaricurvus albidus TaxID=2842452 RepID=UPI001C0CAC8F|nr:SCO family protein [Aestuariicella albida]MBU3071068.1 SCO family protein [Aestuariicella albida]
MFRKHFLSIVCLLLAIAALPLALWATLNVRGSYGVETELELTPFRWHSIEGSQSSLSSLDHSLTLMFMGYLSCEDVCPAMLGTLFSAAEKQGLFDKVGFLFLSVDPKRDTQELRKAVVDSVGDQVYSGVLNAPDLYRLRHELNDPEADSSSPESHSGNLYLLDKHYRVLKIYPYSSIDAAKLSLDLEQILLNLNPDFNRG